MGPLAAAAFVARPDVLLLEQLDAVIGLERLGRIHLLVGRFGRVGPVRVILDLTAVLRPRASSVRVLVDLGADRADVVVGFVDRHARGRSRVHVPRNRSEPLGTSEALHLRCQPDASLRRLSG